MYGHGYRLLVRIMIRRGLSLYLRSAGFEPAIPSLGSSYLNQSGLTSLNQQIHSTNNKFLSLLKHHKLEYLFNHEYSDIRKLDLVLVVTILNMDK